MFWTKHAKQSDCAQYLMNCTESAVLSIIRFLLKKLCILNPLNAELGPSFKIMS